MRNSRATAPISISSARRGAADDAGVAGERALPDAVAEDDDARLALERLVVGERAAHQRRGAEHVKQVAGDAQGLDRLRIAVAGEEDVLAAAAVAAELF